MSSLGVSKNFKNWTHWTSQKVCVLFPYSKRINRDEIWRQGSRYELKVSGDLQRIHTGKSKSLSDTNLH